MKKKLSHRQPLSYLLKSCQNLLILLDLSESFDVPTGCVRTPFFKSFLPSVHFPAKLFTKGVKWTFSFQLILLSIVYNDVVPQKLENCTSHVICLAYPALEDDPESSEDKSTFPSSVSHLHESVGLLQVILWTTDMHNAKYINIRRKNIFGRKMLLTSMNFYCLWVISVITFLSWELCQ